MAIIQLNPPGLTSSSEGYISSITIYTSGAPQVLTPDGNGQITCSALAATRLIGGQGNGGQLSGTCIKLVSG